MTNSYIALEGVSFVLPDGTPLFSQLNETFDSRPTGLVGRNGVGKSVLSQILAGKISPSSGRCPRSGMAYYLAQQILYPPTATVADLAGVRPIIDALERIERGCVSVADFDLVSHHWDIRQRLQHELEQCELGHVSATTLASQLSGGESMRVALIGAWLSEADFLILDEPSNHLDRAHRKALIAQLQRWQAGLLVVSHDRELLESMQRIVELSSIGLSNYGGNYSVYKQLKTQEAQLAQQRLEQRKHERQREEKTFATRKNALRNGSRAGIVMGAKPIRPRFCSAGKSSAVRPRPGN